LRLTIWPESSSEPIAMMLAVVLPALVVK
jgi:hypothetical protein